MVVWALINICEFIFAIRIFIVCKFHFLEPLLNGVSYLTTTEYIFINQKIYITSRYALHFMTNLIETEEYEKNTANLILSAFICAAIKGLSVLNSILTRMFPDQI